MTNLDKPRNPGKPGDRRDVFQFFQSERLAFRLVAPLVLEGAPRVARKTECALINPSPRQTNTEGAPGSLFEPGSWGCFLFS